MKNLKEIIFMPFYIMTDDCLGTIEKLGLGFTMLFLELLIALLLWCGIYAGFNWIGVDSNISRGTVAKHEFVAAHQSGKTSYPDSWHLYIQLTNGGGDWVSVRQSYYDSITNGYQLDTKYYTGRLNQNTWITEIYEPTH